MSTLFTQFGKLRRTADQNSEGIGLGLLICQNLVRECGGTIQAFSEGENCGSVFNFTMQVSPSKDDSSTFQDSTGNSAEQGKLLISLKESD